MGFGDEQARGPWTRKALIGSGSFGVVHEVVDDDAHSYALKVEPLKIRGGQIENEVKILRLLASVPNLPRVIASGVIGEYRGFVETRMGESLDHLLLAAQGTLPLRFMTSVVTDLLTQLERIHKLGIVHRDLKPENICAAPRDGAGPWSLIDFGLASTMTTTTTSARSFSGTVVGTARYASIAAHQGRPIRPADDIESLCYLLLYACR